MGRNNLEMAYRLPCFMGLALGACSEGSKVSVTFILAHSDEEAGSPLSEHCAPGRTHRPHQSGCKKLLNGASVHA